MRTEQTVNSTIKYPDEICFAFNPQILSFEYPIGFENFTITVSGNGKQFTDTRDLIVKENILIGEIDISYYLQMLFNIKRDGKINNTSISAHVDIIVFGGNTIEEFYFETDVIWGAIAIGETFNASQKLTWFKNLPFTFSVYSPAGVSIISKIDGAANQNTGDYTENGVTQQELIHYNPMDFVQDAQQNAVINFGGNGVINTFSFTFSYTFKLEKIEPFVLIELEVSECTNGMYLRWIDRHGFYKYYLFDRSNLARQTANNGEELNVEYFALGKFYNGISRQEKTEQHTRNLSASLIDNETYNLLVGILSSPLVDMYMGKDNDNNDVWLPVNITAGTRTEISAHLQDFEISILLPETVNQKL